MKQKRKRVRRAEFANLNEEEKQQMRVQAEAEGRSFPAEGQDLDQSIYSYYTEQTTGTQPAMPLSGGEAVSLEVSMNEINQDGQRILANSSTQNNNVQIYADLESSGPTEISLGSAKRPTRLSPKAAKGNEFARFVQENQNETIQLVNARPNTPRSGDQKKQSLGSQQLEHAQPTRVVQSQQRLQSPPRQANQETNTTTMLANHRYDTPMQDNKKLQSKNLQQMANNDGLKPQTRALASNSNSNAATAANSVSPDPRQPAAQPQVQISIKPKTDDKTAVVSWSSLLSPKDKSEKQAALKRRVTIQVKSKITDSEAGVGYRNGVLIDKKSTKMDTNIMSGTQQFQRAMTVAVTKQEHEKADMIMRKQMLKRKLTVKVKPDPALKADAKVGWSKPTVGLALNDNENRNNSAGGLDRTQKIVFGSVAAVVCLIHAYMIYKRS